MNITSGVLREVERALEQYEAEVKAAGISRDTERTYLGHTRRFVRWLNDDFTPGGTLNS